MNPSHAIQTLWKHAGPDLSDAALAHLACAEDSANALRNLAQMMAGLGSLIEGDACTAPETETFPGRQDLPGMLFGLATSVATQAELVAVASDAAAMLRLRQVPTPPGDYPEPAPVATAPGAPAGA